MKDDKHSPGLFSPVILSLLAGGYAWQLHGLVIGLVVAFAMATGIAVLQWIMFFRSADSGENGERLLKRMRWLKWSVFIIVMILIGLSGAEIGHVS